MTPLPPLALVEEEYRIVVEPPTVAANRAKTETTVATTSRKI